MTDGNGTRGGGATSGRGTAPATSGRGMAPAMGGRSAPRAAAAAPLPRMIAAQTAMELRLTARRGENLFVTIVLPAALLLFFVTVRVIPTGSDHPVEFLLPGTLGLAIIATSFVNLGIATAYERSYGVLKRLGGSPLPRGGLLAAKVASVAVVEVVQVVFLVAIAVAILGWRPGAAFSPVVAAALALGTTAFASLGLLMAGALRAEATLAGANALFVAFLLVGGVIFPIDRLPGPFASAADLLPAAALTDALRVGFGAAGDALVPLVVLAAWAAATAVLTARTFRWE